MTFEFDCQQCGKHVIARRSGTARRHGRPRFCSQQCNGLSRKGAGNGPTPNHAVTCEHCGKVARVYRSPSAQTPRFCSLDCLGAAQRGDKNPAYAGGRHVLPIGYVVVLTPDHPQADSRGYVYEHRLVAERTLGRLLAPGEVVHHIDGDKLNNEPKNLAVFASQSEHMRHHAEARQ